jgi:hypothetical protein
MKYAFEMIPGSVRPIERIEFPGLTSCRAYQSLPQKQSDPKSPGVSFDEYAKWSMIIREKIPTEESIICPKGSVCFHELSWEDELRIRVSNRLVYNDFHSIVDQLWGSNIRVSLDEIHALFDPFKVLDLSLMLKVIKVYQLPFTIEKVEFSYE